jgi:uncharacterized protein (DUF2062 family)
MAAAAPNDSISFCLSGLLLITVTECPICTNSIVSGLLMCLNEPVTIIFIFYFQFIYTAKLRSNKKTGVAKSHIDVAKIRFAVICAN